MGFWEQTDIVGNQKKDILAKSATQKLNHEALMVYFWWNVVEGGGSSLARSVERLHKR